MLKADLRELLRESAYHDYVYSYPHKSAYRSLDSPPTLREAWAGEDTSALHLYLHVPFCEMRCGFCNLFTEVGGDRDRAGAYLDALERQAHSVRRDLPEARFAQMAVGGGTPTLLSEPGLERLLDLASNVMGVDPQHVPTSVEASPATVTAGKLAVLRSRGVSRLSIGVQSLVAAETAAVLRPQSEGEAATALGLVERAGFPCFNVDLIYGLPGQTPESFGQSLERVLAFQPSELYLYPLYVRSATSLGRRERSWPDLRRELYETGSALLRTRGFRQWSMRRFSKAQAGAQPPTRYRCQEDGMVGLGPGARSYTRTWHYSTPYAVSQAATRQIVDNWMSDDHGRLQHGFQLDPEEQRRRCLILSLLDEGLECSRYEARFATTPWADFPELSQLLTAGLASREGDWLRLTAQGVACSDTIGHWLFSERVRSLMVEGPRA